MAYGVARRRAEFGLRLALGASRGDVSWLVLRETLAVIALGVAIGVPAAPRRHVSSRACSLVWPRPIRSRSLWLSSCSRSSPPSPAISPRAAPRASIRSLRCATNSASHASDASQFLLENFHEPVMGSVRRELRCSDPRVHANDRERSINPALSRITRERYTPRTKGGAWNRKGGPNAIKMQMPETLLTGEEFMRQDTDFRHSYELVEGRLVPLLVTSMTHDIHAMADRGGAFLTTRRWSSRGWDPQGHRGWRTIQTRCGSSMRISWHANVCHTGSRSSSMALRTSPSR